MASKRRSRAWLLTLTLSALGALGGAVSAIALTYFANLIIAAWHPHGLVSYRWNVAALAVTGALFSPVLAWSLLRNVPLWRAVAEPALAAMGATLISFAFASPLFFLLTPGAVLLSAFRLNRAYRPRRAALQPTAQ